MGSHATTTELSSSNLDGNDPKSLNYLLSGPLEEIFVNPCPRAHEKLELNFTMVYDKKWLQALK